ncbi:S8 family serine peptidase [Luteimonas sp. SDU101]|uniref:S8 family serine peptidase n=1 Tax=Luteimonas sp. SDU101 TaxID=3422593 RepID=UPI003EBCA8DC
MKHSPRRPIRLHALAAATAVALSVLVVAPASAGQANLEGLQSDTAFDQFIVKYRDGAPEHADAALRTRGLDDAAASLAAVSSTLQRQGVRAGALRVAHERRLSVGADVIRVNRKLDRADAETLMRQLAADPNVEYVEVDQLMRALMTPNDPRYAEQWGFHSSAGGIRAPAAWDKSTGAGVVVAIVDSGIIAHPDLDANSVGGYDFVSSTSTGNAGSGDGNGRDPDPTDASGVLHGTHVAGTVAAVTNNNTGVAGTAPDARLLHLRVLGNNGYGSTSDIVDAIVWASGGSVSGVPANANPAEVINLSLGGSGSCSATYQNAINSAISRGSTVVIAAGNSNVNVSGASPANCNSIISVAANDQNGARSIWTGGQASNYGNLIDIAAPGTSILSTYRSGSSPAYANNSGTSMAAPHVAGVVALMQAAASSPKTPAEIETIIKQTARAFPSTPSQPIGAGIIDANAAVTAVMGGTPGNAAPAASFTSTVNGLTVQFTDTSTDSDGSIASRSWNFGDGTTSTAANPSKTYAAAGTYSVALTVTDDDGASNTRTQSVTVSGGGGGSVLQNGVPVTGLSASSGNWVHYTMVVPAGASNLNISASGGSGDADLHVRYGSQPTTSAYDCRPYRTGNTETCTFASPQAGTWHVSLRAYSAFSGVSLVGSYSAGGGGGSQTYSNGTDYAINSNATVESPISVSGRSGNAPASTPVAVDIRHTYRGDLKVDLVAPDGSVYVLHNRSGGSADNIIGTYTLNLSSEPLNGNWRLRVNDNAAGDTGYINSWSITF